VDLKQSALLVVFVAFITSIRIESLYIMLTIHTQTKRLLVSSSICR